MGVSYDLESDYAFLEEWYECRYGGCEKYTPPLVFVDTWARSLQGTRSWATVALNMEGSQSQSYYLETPM